MSSRFTGRRERGPRGSPGTGRGGGAHREPVVKVGSAPGARPGRGEAGRRGSGIGSWRGWGAVPVVLRGSPLRLGRHREHGRGGAARGGGRLLAGLGVGYFPIFLSWLPLWLGTPISFPCRSLSCPASHELHFQPWGCFPGGGSDLGDPTHRGRQNGMYRSVLCRRALVNLISQEYSWLL